MTYTWVGNNLGTLPTIVDIYYEFNATYPGTTQSDVLDTGTIKIETNRVKNTL